MNGKCSLGAMNGNIQFIGLVMLACIVIIVAIYYFRDVNNKHSKILEKYEESKTAIPVAIATGTSDIDTNTPYGTTHQGDYRSDDLLQYSDRDITLRDCQVRFADEANCGKNKMCNYVFNDGWKEIAQISDPANPSIYNVVEKKLYNQSETKTDIENQEYMTACFKKVVNPLTDNRYLYQTNDLIKYGYGGGGETIGLKVGGHQGQYISMHFNNNADPSVNYENVLDTISSFKRNTIPDIMGKSFIRLTIGAQNQITNFEKVTINSSQNGFDLVSGFSVSSMVGAGAYGTEYVSGSMFNIFSVKDIPDTGVNIYRFTFNFLENTPPVLSYSKYEANVNIGNILTGVSPQSQSYSIKTPNGAYIGSFDQLITKGINYPDTSLKINTDNWKNAISIKPNKKTTKIEKIKTDLDKMVLIRKKELDKILNDEKWKPDGACTNYCQTLTDYDGAIIEYDSYTKSKNFLLDLPLLGTPSISKGFAFSNIITDQTIATSADTVGDPTIEWVTAIYKHSGGGENQTQYKMNFPANTMCNILIVGGGGGGGKFGGGGGGGGVLFGLNKQLSGDITINVGKGGAGEGNRHDSGIPGSNGADSSITINTTVYKADGGGGGGSRGRGYVGRPGMAGGSGGGGSHSNSSANTSGGAKSQLAYAGWDSYGFDGGMGRPNVRAPAPDHASGGGGGAGGKGGNYRANGLRTDGGGDGGFGIDFTKYFGTNVGDNGWFAGGGGGNTYHNSGRRGYGNGGITSLGGGGHGGFDKWGVEDKGEDAKPNTGGGGGGSRWDEGANTDLDGGYGGSGIVIIQYKLAPITASNNKYLSFIHNGLNNQSSYKVNFTEETECDILVVGGGGGGGGGIGGGGGAGAVVHLESVTLPKGEYTVTVGDGGIGKYRAYPSDKGVNSSISSTLIDSIIAEGGGGTTGGHDHGNGSVGGSGGGAASPNGTLNKGGAAGNSSSLGGFTGKIYGNRGGNNTATRTRLYSGTTNAAGGGGAGEAAQNSDPNSSTPGNGGSGISINITGTLVYYGGGGGGGGHMNAGNGGFGGGGNGDSSSHGSPGIANTGGGGGGGGWEGYIGGKGGSGIVIISLKPNISKFLTTVTNTYTYNKVMEESFDKKQSFALTILSSDKVQKNILTSFVFLETGYYRFKYDLIQYNQYKVNLKIVIYDNDDNGLPSTTIRELNNLYDTTFVSKGGFYKIAFCYILYNKTGSAINYNFKFEAKYSFTNISDDLWKTKIFSDMNDYLYKDDRLYTNLFDRTLIDNSQIINKYFKKESGFLGYTSITNPGHDVFSNLKTHYLDTDSIDEFSKHMYTTDKNTYLNDSSDLEVLYNHDTDSQIIYIKAIKKELIDINYSTLFGVQSASTVILPSPATDYIVSHNTGIPPEFITYSGIGTKSLRTPANMTDTTFNVISNSTKYIYIESS